MNSKLTAVAAAANRARHRAGLDRNPMRRREDHIQTTVGIILTLVFLVSAPWAALLVGGQVYRSGAATERVQHAQRHPVTATVVDPGKSPGHSTTTTLQVSWQSADGVRHVADYQGVATDVGAKTTLWVDRAGNVVREPRRHAETISDAVLAGSGVDLAILGVLLTGQAMLRRRLDRSRYRLWDAGWAWANVKWGLPGNRPGQG